jgi:hypothetical protein
MSGESTKFTMKDFIIAKAFTALYAALFFVVDNEEFTAQCGICQDFVTIRESSQGRISRKSVN